MRDDRFGGTGRRFIGAVGLLLAMFALSDAGANAQQPPQGAKPQAQPSPREASPIDLTGYWVAIVNEDWRWRMMTPPKGDYASVPLNPEGRKVADTWQPRQQRPWNPGARSPYLFRSSSLSLLPPSVCSRSNL